MTKGYLKCRCQLLEKYVDKAEILQIDLVQDPEGNQNYISSVLFLQIESNYTTTMRWLTEIIEKMEVRLAPPREEVQAQNI